MAEFVERRSALEAVYRAGATGGAIEGATGEPAVTLAERRPLSIVHVAGDASAKAFADGVKSATGCALPIEPNTVSRSGNDAVLWLAPTRWLAVSPDQGHGVLEGALRVACGDTGAVIDVSHGRTVIRISGPRARTVLMKGAPLDFHPTVFTPGTCAQTSVAQCGTLIVCVEDDVFDVYVFRAFGRHMFEFLEEASREFGYAIGETVSG